MPTTNNRQLTLIRNGDTVTLFVDYNVVFSAFERQLARLGLQFRERIAVIGVDPPGATTGTLLDNLQVETIPVANSPVLSIPRTRTKIYSRAALDEDNGRFEFPDLDADEIRCRIRIEAIGLPPAVTPDEFTDQEILGGLVTFPVATAAQA
jgi:hypothetical protein